MKKIENVTNKTIIHFLNSVSFTGEDSRLFSDGELMILEKINQHG
jgi:hypothetical protein